MCMGCGVSQKDMNILSGIAASFVLTIFQIYQFIQLSFDGEIIAIKVIVFTWVISKLLSLRIMLKDYNSSGIIYYILALIFQDEWYFNCQSDQDSIMRVMGQQLVLTFPTTIVNIYLLSDTSRDITHGYYIAMIFINYLVLGICIITVIQENDSQSSFKKLLIKGVPSIFANFSFLYLLVQSFLFNKYIGISLLIINCLIGVIDYIIFRKHLSYQYNRNLIFINVLQYIFQINCFTFKTYSKQSSKLKLMDWEPLLKLGVQCLNIAILIIVKFSCYPLIIQLDKAFYVFLAFSLPQFYFLAINLYYKLTKQNYYNLILNFGEEKLNIEKKAYNLLSDRFVFSYGVKVNVNIQNLDTFNKQQFIDNIKILRHFLEIVRQSQQDDINVQINDINHQLNIKMHKKRYENQLEQTIQIGSSFFDNPFNLFLIQYLSLLMKQSAYQKVNVFSPTNQVESFLIDIQAFNKYVYDFSSHYSKNCHLLNDQLSKIISNNYQILAFNKNIQEYTPINPIHLLYDLYSDII